MMTTPDIHGHEILRLVLAAPQGLARAELVGQAQQRFGAAARYRTCSTQGMTLEELLAFLLSRGKLVERESRLVADAGQMCADA